jgi:RND family efflux transporter MFP subunit
VDETGLAFGVSGQEYGEFYVSVGDRVKKGDILAELDMSGIEETIEETEREYKQKQLEAQHYDTMIADAKAIGALDGTSSADLSQQLSELRASKSDAVAAYNIAKTRYEEALKAKENRQIIAPSDGTVSFVFDTSTQKKESSETPTSNRELTMIKLNSGSYVYTTQTTEYRNYPVGTEVLMTIDGQSYTLEVTKNEVVDSGDDEKEEHELTLKLPDSNVSIDPSAVARSRESVKTLTNVVYVPEDAIVTLDGKNYAYVVDEDGMRSAVFVETGLSNGEYIEIVSGLTPGQQVILK